jgi:DNA-binding NtrC family response regulator
MPSLRECRGDLALLAQHFLAITARSYGRDAPELGPDALDMIEHYDWPGNVRELRNVIERAVLLTPGAVVAAKSLALSQSAFPQTQPSIPIGDPGSSMERASTLDDAERQLIVQALRQAKGNVSEAARALGVTRMALRYRIEKHGLRSADFRVG